MDFSKQIVAAWARQDVSLQRRAEQKANTPAISSGLNANGRDMLVLSDGSFAPAPTNSNANLAGQPVKYGAGLALSKVATV